MVSFKRPCFCISSWIGSLIIAVLEMVYSGTQLVLAIFYSCVFGFTPFEWAYYGYCAITSCNEKQLTVVKTVECVQQDFVFGSRGELRAPYNIFVILVLVNVTFTSILLRGIHKKNPSFLQHWIMYQIIWMLVNICIKLLLACMKGKTLFADLPEFSFYVLKFYFTYVVCDLHEEMVGTLVLRKASVVAEKVTEGNEFL